MPFMPRHTETSWSALAWRRTQGRADPDVRSRSVALPLAWPEDDAADALAALAPAGVPASLRRAAEPWIARATTGGLRCGLLAEAADAERLAEELRALLLTRRGAAGAPAWAGEAEDEPRFVLNLAAFLDPEGGFDAPAYAAAVRTGLLALEGMTEGKARKLRVGFADLAGLLAGLRLDYASAEARTVAAGIAALTRGAAEAASGECAERLGARASVTLLWPALPDSTALPGLAEAARAAVDSAARMPGLRHEEVFALAPADAVEALLGAETAGLAPAPGSDRLGHDGAGRPSAAALRAGAAAESLLAPRGPEARAAMLAALSPFLSTTALAPVADCAAPRPAPRAAPTRAARGHVWKATVGGHRVALRTTEGAEGQLAEVSLTLSKDSAQFRGMLEAFCHSVSLGLAHGVPLSEFVQMHAYTRFGPAGAVEGDPAIRRATSILDWAFRRLALEHLAGPALPDPSEEDCGSDGLGTPSQQQPLLPLDGPEGANARVESPAARRRGLRLVG